MQQLLFLSRLACICNVCFVLTAIFKFVPALKQGHFVSTVLVLGLPVAFVLNLVVHTGIAIVILKRKKVKQHMPSWLMIFNLLCLVLQLIYFLQ